MEKYGEIPKKFTSKWFEYVWEYYKWHIIAVIAAVIAVFYTWYQFATRTVYDLTICFAGNTLIGEQAEERLADALTEVIEDIDGDGERNVRILDLSAGETKDFEMQYMMEQKLHLELQAGDTYLFIVSKDTADMLTSNSSIDGLFAKTAEWCGEKGENEFFAEVEDSAVLRQSGMIYKGLHAGLRNFVAGRDSETDAAMRNNAILAGQAILK